MLNVTLIATACIRTSLPRAPIDTNCRVLDNCPPTSAARLAADRGFCLCRPPDLCLKQNKASRRYLAWAAANLDLRQLPRGPRTGQITPRPRRKSVLSMLLAEAARPGHLHSTADHIAYRISLAAYCYQDYRPPWRTASLPLLGSVKINIVSADDQSTQDCSRQSSCVLGGCGSQAQSCLGPPGVPLGRHF